MQYGSFEIRLEGKMINTVVRHNCTPAEVEVLKALHGVEAVEPIHITHEKETLSETELERLGFIYCTKTGQEAIKSLFPGSRPRLPTTFKDVGYYDLPHKNEKTAAGLSKPNGMTIEQARAVLAAAEKSERFDADAIAEGKAKAAESAQPVVEDTEKAEAPKKTVAKRPAPESKFDKEVKISYPEEQAS